MNDQMFIDLVASELQAVQSDHGINRKRSIDESNAELIPLTMQESESAQSPQQSKSVEGELSNLSTLSTESETQSSTESLYPKEQEEQKTQDWSHITEADLELKEFECPRCLGKFPSSCALFRHMRMTYADPLKCQECGKVWKDMANMLSHSYLHRGLKPYKCPKCSFSTRTRFNLRVHFGSCANIERFSYKRQVRRNRGKKRRLNERVSKTYSPKEEPKPVAKVTNQSNAAPITVKNQEPISVFAQIGNLLDDMIDDGKCTDAEWDTVKVLSLCPRNGALLQEEYSRLAQRLGNGEMEKLFRGLLRFARLAGKQAV